MQNRKIQRRHDADRCIFTGDSDAPFRIHRPCAVARAPGEMYGRLAVPRRTYFGRRGPWGGSGGGGTNNTTTEGRYRRSNTPMGRWPGELIITIIILIIISIIIYNNSPGHGPIGVLDPSLGCVLKVPRPRKVGAPGPSAAKVGATLLDLPPANRCQGHGDLMFSMDSFDAITIHPKNAGIRAVDRPRI